jgi:GNAT superfamily N-acetyltransferase
MTKSECLDISSKNKHIQDKQQIKETRLHLSMRRAERQDIDELAVMSRSCYPYLLRWQGPLFHNIKRWRLLLDTECCEAWVCLSHGQIIGYFTLILDRQQHDEVDGKPHPGLFVRLYMLGVCPKLFVTIALRKLKRCIHSSLRQLFASSSDDNKMAGSKTLGRFDDRQVPWVGYVAVTPAMQGKGVATEMVKFCTQRAVELGYKEIWANVERKNLGASGLMKKAGFVVTEGINHLMLAKQL